ncbi:hypothetical protein [Flexithrix dorotheae]|uniref:hypothetical protein n=1 Tax=Flexithrix dorotheae TaxID=70993 RepID=UPI000371C303|nr:hypothetical protein [Flexithrix dorotheae]
MLTLGSLNLFAQEEEPITEEDLKKYAVTMDSIDAMKDNIKTVMGDMIKSNENITTKRYNEVTKAINDEEKLKEIEATEEEIAFVNSIITTRDEMTAEIKSTLSTMVKEYIGSVKLYNRIKKELKSDEELKSQYDEILAEVQAEGGDEEVEESKGN